MSFIRFCKNENVKKKIEIPDAMEFSIPKVAVSFAQC